MSLKRSHAAGARTSFTSGSESSSKLGRQELYDELKKLAQSGQVFAPVDIALSIGAGEALVTLTGCLCERVTGHVLRSETARVDLLQDLLDEIKDILASFARCYHQTREFTGTEEVGKLEELYSMI